MSYASAKGYGGEKEVEEFLDSIFRQFGIEWMRVGGVEKKKRVFPGDVVIDPRRSKNGENCVLRGYLIESKKQASVHLWRDADKARDDAAWHGLGKYILFAQLQAKGEKVRGRKLAVMDWDTLGSLLTEIQGYRNEIPR